MLGEKAEGSEPEVRRALDKLDPDRIIVHLFKPDMFRKSDDSIVYSCILIFPDGLPGESQLDYW